MQEIINRYLAGDAINALARRYDIPYSTLYCRLTKIARPIRRRGQHEVLSAVDRFLKYAMPEPNSGCWVWLGQIANKYGYGTMWLNGRKVTAQRASWILLRGQIPDKYEIDHKCNNPSCVNPDHLRPLTKKENLAQRVLTKKYCRKGHPLADGNLIYEKGGTVRRCKICRQARRRMK